jgi:hypothetical protein
MHATLCYVICPLLRYYVIYRRTRAIVPSLQALGITIQTLKHASQTRKTLYTRATREGKVSTDSISMFIFRLPSHRPRGTDLAPSGGIYGTSISTERIPKSAARVLDAARIRAEYRQKRARLQTDEADVKPPPPKKHRTNAGRAEAGKSGKTLAKGNDKPVGTIEIQPGESLKHFNRCAFPRSPQSFNIRKGEPVSHDCAPFAFLSALHIQESRGPYASAGTIGCPGFGRDRAQSKESSDSGCLLQ